jgi:hypothetical protein
MPAMFSERLSATSALNEPILVQPGLYDSTCRVGVWGT